ncbi:hypothetical protein K439DRAFT_1613958 [Ramaria rubella]|nr:hypothetical protein K439DRAFT_1613958 [Ramaria rubella]
MSDTEDWYACSKSYKTHIRGEMKDALKTYNSISHALARVPFSSDFDPLPVVEFGDLSGAVCVSLDSLSNKYVGPIPLPSANPFAPPEAPRFKLIVTYVFPTDTQDEVDVQTTNIALSMTATESTHTFPDQGGKKLHTFPEAQFTMVDNVQVLDVNKSLIFRLLTVFSQAECQSFYFFVEIDYTVRITKLPDLSNLYNILLNDVILEKIATHLTLKEIGSLRATSRALAYKLVRQPTRRLRALFEEYFSDPSCFAACLRATGAIVGGLAILSIPCPGNWKPGDLDRIILATDLQHSWTVKDSFLNSLQHPPSGTLNPTMPGSETHHGPRKVDLSVVASKTYGVTPGDFTLTYHSTPVMNLYNGHGIFCLFPMLTFNHLLFRNRESPSHRQRERMEQCIRKYLRRGFKESHPGQYIQSTIVVGRLGRLHLDMLPPIWHQKVDL